MPEPESGLAVAVLDGVTEIAAADWDACAAPEAADGGRPFDPFTTHRFLVALERSGSVGPGTGWTPHPLVVRSGDQVIAVAPLYLKGHSQGEYIFDHGWAEAWHRAGGRYYPKLQIAVPFTPVTGRRLVTRPGHEAAGRAALIGAARALAEGNGLSSLHMTFCTGDEAEAAVRIEPALLPRLSQQFHWQNRGYGDFDAFLAALSARKRKAIRRERAQASAFGGRILRLSGDDLRPDHWDALWAFYQDTGQRKWGRPYLTRAFFDLLHQTMRHDILLVLAERDGRAVAGALNVLGRDTLYGRYWGAVEDHPLLHFECCYYQAMDHAIALGLSRIEAGAQGEHKLARGYLPRATHSLHWIADPRLRQAVGDFLRAEHAAVTQDMAALRAQGPFRQGDDWPEPDTDPPGHD